MAKRLKAAQPEIEQIILIDLNEIKLVDLMGSDHTPDQFKEILGNWIYCNATGIEVADIGRALNKTGVCNIKGAEFAEVFNIVLQIQGFGFWAMEKIRIYFTDKLTEFNKNKIS